MLHNDLISVIIPAYNHEKYVQQTIKSIIAQTYKNIELIVINDGSKDSTWQKIQELKPECEKRFTSVQFSTQENSGTCKTQNKLIAMASGEYIYLIASDDIALPNAIEKLYSAITTDKDCVLAVGNENFIDAENNLIGVDSDFNATALNNAKYPNFCDFYTNETKNNYFTTEEFGSYKSLLERNYIPNGYLVKTSACKKIQFTKEAPLEDLYMHLQLSKMGKYKFIDEILFSYRLHGVNTSSNKQHMLNMTEKTLKYEETLCHSEPKYKEIFRKTTINQMYLNLGILQLYRRKIIKHKIYCIRFFNKEFILKTTN